MPLTRQIACLLLASLGVACLSFFMNGGSAALIAADNEHKITLAEAMALPSLLWVDARSQSAYDEAHIPEAVLLNEDNWDALIGTLLNEWQPDSNIVVYCDSSACGASESVAKKLREDFQMEHVYVLREGWVEWLER